MSAPKKRMSDEELIADLRLFHHYESAKRLGELLTEVKRLRAQLAERSTDDADRTT